MTHVEGGLQEAVQSSSGGRLLGGQWNRGAGGQKADERQEKGEGGQNPPPPLPSCLNDAATSGRGPGHDSGVQLAVRAPSLHSGHGWGWPVWGFTGMARVSRGMNSGSSEAR